MELYYINLANFKRKYFVVLVVELLAVLGCYLYQGSGFRGWPPGSVWNNIRILCWIVVWVPALIYPRIYKKKLAALQALADFDEKVKAYERVHAFRLGWVLVNVLVFCVAFLFIPKRLFLEFAVIDLVLTLLHYPMKEVIRKELQNEEIAFD